MPAKAAWARRGDIPAAISPTVVAPGTDLVDPSGRVMVIWDIQEVAGPSMANGQWPMVDGQSIVGDYGLSRPWPLDYGLRMVGAGGIEPLTSCVSGRRSNR